MENDKLTKKDYILYSLFVCTIISVAFSTYVSTSATRSTGSKMSADLSEQKTQIAVLRAETKMYRGLLTEMSKERQKEKEVQKIISTKYLPVYEKIILTHDSLQLNITEELLEKHRSIRFER